LGKKWGIRGVGGAANHRCKGGDRGLTELTLEKKKKQFPTNAPPKKTPKNPPHKKKPKQTKKATPPLPQKKKTKKPPHQRGGERASWEKTGKRRKPASYLLAKEKGKTRAEPKGRGGVDLLREASATKRNGGERGKDKRPPKKREKGKSALNNRKGNEKLQGGRQLAIGIP